MDSMEKIENFIRERNVEKAHMLRTPFWLKEIYPEADEAMLIAALCHDIERCFPLGVDEMKPAKIGDDAKDIEYLKWHGNRSAELTEKLLRENGFNDEVTLARIKTFIAEHSFGGTKERDVIRDADSISLLENSAEILLKAGRKKINSEYNRLSSKKAREFAQPFFDEIIKKLN